MTKQEIVQICPPPPRGSGGGSPKVPSSIFFLNLLQLKICAFDKDQRLSKLEAIDGKHVTLRCPKHPGPGFTKGLKFRQFFCLDKS